MSFNKNPGESVAVSVKYLEEEFNSWKWGDSEGGGCHWFRALERIASWRPLRWWERVFGFMSGDWDFSEARMAALRKTDAGQLIARLCSEVSRMKITPDERAAYYPYGLSLWILAHEQACFLDRSPACRERAELLLEEIAAHGRQRLGALDELGPARTMIEAR